MDDNAQNVSFGRNACLCVPFTCASKQRNQLTVANCFGYARTLVCLSLDFAFGCTIQSSRCTNTIRLLLAIHTKRRKKNREKKENNIKTHTYEQQQQNSGKSHCFSATFCSNKCTLAFWNFQQVNDYKVLPHRQQILFKVAHINSNTGDKTETKQNKNINSLIICLLYGNDYGKLNHGEHFNYGHKKKD